MLAAEWNAKNYCLNAIICWNYLQTFAGWLVSLKQTNVNEKPLSCLNITVVIAITAAAAAAAAAIVYDYWYS